MRWLAEITAIFIIAENDDMVREHKEMALSSARPRRWRAVRHYRPASAAHVDDVIGLFKALFSITLLSSLSSRLQEINDGKPMRAKCVNVLCAQPRTVSIAASAGEMFHWNNARVCYVAMREERAKNFVKSPVRTSANSKGGKIIINRKWDFNKYHND